MFRSPRRIPFQSARRGESAYLMRNDDIPRDSAILRVQRSEKFAILRRILLVMD
jgi:hypothetical protein